MNVMFSVMLTCGMMIVAGTKRVAPPGSTPIVTKKLGLGATDGPDGVAEATEIAGGTAKIAIRTAITRSAEFLILRILLLPIPSRDFRAIAKKSVPYLYVVHESIFPP